MKSIALTVASLVAMGALFQPVTLASAQQIAQGKIYNLKVAIFTPTRSATALVCQEQKGTGGKNRR